MRNIAAIILAGGRGERLGGKYKQFMKIGGKPLIFYSIEKFLKLKLIESIIIVVPSGKLAYAKKLILKKFPDARLNFISGGGTRKESAYNGLKWLKKSKTKTDYVIFHDAVRPLVSVKMIKVVIEESRKWGSVAFGVRTIDSISTVKNHFIDSVLGQESIYNISTPHCYKFDLIWRAYKAAVGKSFLEKAENAELIFNIGGKIRIMEGFYPNIKLTYKEDLPILENILKSRK